MINMICNESHSNAGKCLRSFIIRATVKLGGCVLSFCLVCWGFLFVCFSKFPSFPINFAPLISSLDFLPCTKEIPPDLTSKSFMDDNTYRHKYAVEQ